MTLPPHSRPFLSAARVAFGAALGAFLFFAAVGQAQTNISWNLNGGGNWNTSGNWSPANVPNTSTELAIFNKAAGGTITYNITGTTTVGGITFNSSAGAYTISRTGTVATLNIGTYGINQNDGTAQTITGSGLLLSLASAAAFNVNSTGGLTISTTGGAIATTATNKLTLGGNGTGVGSISTQITGAGLLTKSGSSTWTLSSASNNYTGGTTIAGGTLVANANNALGTSGTISFTGGELQYGTGITTDYSARIANSTGAILVDTNGNNVTFASALGATNVGGLTKLGTGTLTLTGANSYAGTTTVGAGALNIQNSSALGSTSGGTTVASGAALELQGGIAVGAETLTINGTGIGAAGALRNVSGNNSWAGPITLGSAAKISSDAGTLTLTGGITGSNLNLTVGGAGNTTISTAGLSLGNGSLTKADAGTLALNIANSYTGGTTFAGGTLTVNDANALGASGNLTFTGGTLQYGTGITTDYSTRVANSTGAVAIDTNGNNVTFASSLAATNTGGLTKSGTGTLTLTAANNYTGTTTISGGALNIQDSGALGTGAVTVNAGGTLEVQRGAAAVTAGNDITLAGGTLKNVSGDINWLQGNVTLTANSTIYSATAGDRLYVGNVGASATTIALGTNTLTVDGPGNTVLIGAIGTGTAGNFVSNSTGDVWFNAQGQANNYTGTTTVNRGTLYLGTDNNSAFYNQTIRGDLIIGNGVDAAAVVYPAGYGNEKIADTSAVTVNRFGTYNLNSAYETIGALNLNGGNVALGAGGTLVLTGDVTVGNSPDTATVSGYQFWLTPASGDRIITVADGAQTTDFLVTATVASGNLVKAGAGTMTLAGNNIFTGTATVNAGVLNLRSNTALGGTTNGTTVATGAALELQQDPAYNGGAAIAIGNEALTLNGTGVGNAGALRNITGDNSWAGAITLASAARINSDANTLTLNGNIVGVGQNLTVGGAGNTWINGAIGTAAGTLTKDGTGTLTLTGSNNYSGATTINSGVVNVRHNYGLGSAAGGTVVASGAALELQADAAYNGGQPITVGNEALSLSGTGVNNGGALRNVAGNNTYGGAVTVAAPATRINSDSGTLTLSNTVALGTNNLTTGGAGNITISGALTGAATGMLTKTDAGTLTIASSGNTSFQSDITLTSGSLVMAANNALNNAAVDVAVNGGTFSLQSYAQSIGAISGVGEINFGGNGSLTLQTNSMFAGTFTGTGTIVVSSGVTLTLGTNFNAAGVTIVLAGGTLAVNGTTSTFAGLSLTGNSTIDFSTASNSVINFTNLSLGTYSLAVAGWTDALDVFHVTNNPGTYGAPPLNQVTFAPSGAWTGNDTIWTGNYTGYTYNDEVRPWKPVPEPSTYGAMFMGAALAFLGYRRWRQQSAVAKK